MNGKIKTKFAALFAVALMITVCVVPVVGNEGTDAAPVSSSNGEVFEGYELKLFTEGMDNYDDLVYYGPQAVAGIASSDYEFIEIGTVGSEDVGYLVDKDTGLFLRFVDIPNYSVEYIVLPIVQLTYTYAGASINAVDVDVVVKQGTSLDKKFENKGQTLDIVSGTEVTKKEGIFTFGLYENQGTDNLGLTKAKAVGNFDVEITATQGITQQVIKQTINAGPATVVSGTITDAGNTIIASVYNKNAFSNGLKVKYTINGAGSYTADVGNDGKYQFNVAPGSVVEITDIAWYNGAAEVTTNEPYTFENGTFPYSFGTVTDSTQKSFKAKEYTTSVSIYDADGNALSNYAGISASGTWYSEVKDSTDSTYDISKITGNGSATLVKVSDGKAYLSYAEPTGLSANVSSYLVISASSSGSGYSFVTESNYTDDDSPKTLSQLVDEKAGDAIKSSNASVKATQKTVTITVNDKGSNPAKVVAGEEPTIKLYSQKDADSDGYIITNTSTSFTLVNSDDNRYTYAYNYTAETGFTYIMVAEGQNNGIYTFDVVPVNTGTASNPVDKTVLEQIAGKAGMAVVQNAKATINAKETTYAISGNVEDAKENNVVSITYNTNNSAPVVDGKFTFYVKEGTIVTIKSISGYDPKTGFALGTIDSAKTVEFTKTAGTVDPTPVKYRVILDKTESGDKTVIFNYTVNGEPFTFSQTGGSSAEVSIPAYVGDEIVVSATIYGDVVYSVSAFENYQATAVQMETYYFKATDGSEGISGATFDITYTYKMKQETIALTADENGIVKFSLPSNGVSGITASKDGKYVPYTNAEFYVGLNEVNGYAVDLGEYYGDASATVSIVYGAVYNVEDVSYGPVAYESFGTATSKTVVKSIALKAPSIDNFEFVAWMVDGVVVSESADYTLVVEDGEAYKAVALYSAVHYEEPAEGLSMNVLVIGIVILILGILAVAYGIISKKQ